MAAACGPGEVYSSAVTENGGKVIEVGLESVLVSIALVAGVRLVAVPVGASFISSRSEGAYWRWVTVPEGGLMPPKLRLWLLERSVLISTRDRLVPFSKQKT